MDAFSDRSELSDAPTPGPPLTPGHLSPAATPSPEPAPAAKATPASSKQAKYGKRDGGGRGRGQASGARRSSRTAQPSGSSPAAADAAIGDALPDDEAPASPLPAPIPSKQKSRDPKRARLIQALPKLEVPDASSALDDQEEAGSSRRPGSARARKSAKREPATLTEASSSSTRRRRVKGEPAAEAGPAAPEEADKEAGEAKVAESSQRKIKIKLKRAAQPEAAKPEPRESARVSPPTFRSESEDEYEESDNEEVIVPTKSRRGRKAPVPDFIDDGESDEDEAGPSASSRAKQDKARRAAGKAPQPNKRKAEGERPEPAAAAGKKAKPTASASGPLQLPRKAGELRAGEVHTEPARPRSSLSGPLGGASASTSAASGSPAAPPPVKKPAPRPSGMSDFSSIFGGSPAPKPAPPKAAAPPSASKPNVRPPDAPPRPAGPKPLGLATKKPLPRPATPGSRSAQQAPGAYGANGEHVTAEEMAALRIKEQKRNADTSDLFDLLAPGEGVIAWEEEAKRLAKAHPEQYRPVRPTRSADTAAFLIHKIKAELASQASAPPVGS